MHIPVLPPAHIQLFILLLRPHLFLRGLSPQCHILSASVLLRVSEIGDSLKNNRKSVYKTSWTGPMDLEAGAGIEPATSGLWDPIEYQTHPQYRVENFADLRHTLINLRLYSTNEEIELSFEERPLTFYPSQLSWPRFTSLILIRNWLSATFTHHSALTSLLKFL